MKITTKQLKQIIKEEISNLLNEGSREKGHSPLHEIDWETASEEERDAFNNSDKEWPDGPYPQGYHNVGEWDRASWWVRTREDALEFLGDMTAEELENIDIKELTDVMKILTDRS